MGRLTLENDTEESVRLKPSRIPCVDICGFELLGFEYSDTFVNGP